MSRPAGIKQAKYIAPLTAALGRKTNYEFTRHTLKHAGIYPYVGREKEALQLFIGQGYDLSKYQPVEQEAQEFLKSHYGKLPEYTSLMAPPQQSLPLLHAQPNIHHPADKQNEPQHDAPNIWEEKLIPRLAKLLDHLGHGDLEKQKQLARKFLTKGGYPRPKTGKNGKRGQWTDEARALRVFQEAGISTEGFESRTAGTTIAVNNNAHISKTVATVPPQQLALQLARLQEEVNRLAAQLRMKELVIQQTEQFMNAVVATSYDDLDVRRENTPGSRLTRAELMAHLNHLNLLDTLKEGH